jgi:membrane fusion protein, multidrug efflux system
MAFLPSFVSRRRIGIFGGLIVIGLIAIGVRELNGNTPPASRGAGLAAVPVTAAIATRQDVPDVVNAIGNVQSIDSVAVQPRVTGTIAKIEFTPGQDVKKGQELFLIDPRPFQAALDQAEAQLAHDEGVLAEAQMDLTRYQLLTKQNSIAKQQAQDQFYVVQQDQGTVDLDQANVETAQLNLQYCHVASPIDGRAGALLVDLGNLVGPQTGNQSANNTALGTTTTAGQTMGAGASTLVSIAQLQPIYVSFNIPQTRLAEILRNQAAGPLEVDAYSQAGQLLEHGKVTLINNQVNISTGTILLQGTFANTDKQLWPGEFVTVNLIVAMRHNVVTVPATAIMAGPNGFYVYVIGANNKVRRINVQVAARQSGIAVITKGVFAGEKVVSNGQYRLANGVQVDIRSTTTTRMG